MFQVVTNGVLTGYVDEALTTTFDVSLFMFYS
jgi:hypothetical protein